MHRLIVGDGQSPPIERLFVPEHEGWTSCWSHPPAGWVGLLHFARFGARLPLICRANPRIRFFLN